MFKRFLKPRWQHKNPTVRLSAIPNIKDEAILIKIANSDDDPDVCNTAIQQVSSTASLFKITPPQKSQASLNQQFSKLIKKEAAQLSFHPSIAKRLQRINSLELNTVVANQAKDVQLRETAISLIDDKEQTLLAHYAATDSSSKIRLIAAQRLQNEALIRTTLKQLGKKDKRVTKALRGHLDAIESQQARQREIQNILESIKQIGHNDQCQRNQTQLNTHKNHWSKLGDLSQKDNELFSQACNSAQDRIDQWQQKLELIKPRIEAKESQCALAEDFLTQLNQRQRLSSLEVKDLRETLEVFHQDWKQLDSLPEAFEAKLTNRFQHTLRQLKEKISLLQENARFTVGLERIIHKAEEQLRTPHIPSQFINTLVSDWEKQKQPENPQLREEYQSQFSRLIEALRVSQAKQQRTLETELKNIQAGLSRIEASLADDQLNDTEVLFKQIKTSLGKLAGLSSQEKLNIKKRLQKIAPRIQELKGWRHWGTDQARKELIDEAVALKNKHQDANTRAAAVRELRAHWKKLGQIDPASGHNLWKTFDTACTEAYALSQAHFDEEKKIRQQNLRHREKICDEYEALKKNTDWDSPDWRNIDKQTRTLQSRWRKSGPVNRRNWKAILKRYKSAESAIELRLRDERRINLNKRVALIESLEALRDHDNLAEAIQAAKDAQRAWQPSVTGKRSDEQKLWKQFRAAADAIFDRDKEKREIAREELNKVLDNKKSVCAAAEKLANSKDISSSDISKLRSQWNSIENNGDKRANALEQRFKRAMQSIKKASERGHRKQQLKQLSSLLEKHDVLEALEKAVQRNEKNELIENLKQQWHSMGDKKISALQTRFEKANRGALNSKELEDNISARASLLLDLEILLELKSPPELAEKRMQKQVDRLAEAMIQKDGQDNLLEYSLQRIKAYSESGAVTPEYAEQFSSRLIPIVACIESKLIHLTEG